MEQDNFDIILQQLNNGQNPTPVTDNSGITASERGLSNGTQNMNFGFRPFNEGIENANSTSNN